MIGDYFSALELPFVDVPTQVFHQGIIQPNLPEALYAAIDAHPSIYIGFRTLFGLERCRSLSTARRIVLVRDPRDALVSHYYSIRYSHPLPLKGDNRNNMLAAREEAAKVGIDEFITRVQRGRFICRTMRSLSALIGPQTTLYKYEVVVFQKAEWLRSMLSEIGVGRLDDGLIGEIASRHDVLPENEDASRHIRQVRPGNYRAHLQHDTIRWIEQEYPDLFQVYGYAVITHPPCPQGMAGAPLTPV